MQPGRQDSNELVIHETSIQSIYSQRMSQVQVRGQKQAAIQKTQTANSKWTHNSDELSEYEGKEEEDGNQIIEKSDRKSTSTVAFQESDPQSGVKASVELTNPKREVPPSITE